MTTLSATLTDKYGRTVYASMAALQAARWFADTRNTAAARTQLQWVVDHADRPEIGAIARVRLAGVLLDEKNYDEALKRLTQVTRSNTAPAPLRANGMLLFGKIKEEQGDYQSAIDNYIKIASFYSGVPEAAAEGLLRGAQLLERQGKGEIPMPKPEKKAAPAKKK